MLPNRKGRYTVFERRNEFCEEPTKALGFKHTKSICIPDVYPLIGSSLEDSLNSQTIQKGYEYPVVVGEESSGTARFLIKNSSDLAEKIIANYKVLRKLHHQKNKLVDLKELPPRQHNLAKEESVIKWLNMFASGAPIPQLAKKSPVLKTESIISLLYERGIPFIRAAWLVQIHLKHEITSKRSRPNRTKAEVFDEWTGYITRLLAQQMKQVAVPRGPPSFLQKFDYTFYFLCHQTKEGLTSPDVLLNWFIDKLATADDFQLCILLLRSLLDFLPYFAPRRSQSRRLFLACTRLLKLFSSNDPRGVGRLAFLLVQFLVVMFPTAFVGFALESDFRISNLDWLPDFSTPIQKCLQLTFEESVRAIERRSLLLFSKDLLLEESSEFKELLKLSALDCFSSCETRGDASRSLEDLFGIIFPHDQQSDSLASHVDASLFLLCRWATISHRIGASRRLVAVYLLLLLKKKAPSLFLHALLYDFLEKYKDECMQSIEEFAQLVELFGDFVREGLFDYLAYMSRLITCNKKMLQSSFHWRFVQALPCYSADAYARNLRRCLLFDQSLLSDDCSSAVLLSCAVEQYINSLSGGDTPPLMLPIHYYFNYYRKFYENMTNHSTESKCSENNETNGPLLVNSIMELPCLYQRDISAWIHACLQERLANEDYIVRYDWCFLDQLSELLLIISALNDFSVLFSCLELLVAHTSSPDVHLVITAALSTNWRALATSIDVHQRLFAAVAKSFSTVESAAKWLSAPIGQVGPKFFSVYSSLLVLCSLSEGATPITTGSF
jgi:hypothetical protein